MKTSPNSLVSSSSRALKLRMRGDLCTERQYYQGELFFVVKDPVSLKYYRFHEEEFALLEMLDGRRSLDEIRRQFQRRFAPQKMSLEELTAFVGSLHEGGLVVSDAPGQAERLLQRRRENTRRQRLGALTNILSIRMPGFDPDRLLTWLDAYVGWMFSRAMTVVGLLLCLAAATLVTVQFDAFRGRLPAFGEFFASENWFWLALALAATKVLHEFGHGLVCKRLGSECHEVGVLLLVLTPCLYVDVSDSWMLPSKWRRAAIGAAGMYVEVVLASICTFVWWFTEPGLLNYLCLNVMFVSSVSTLLFNANPLLRYDGYYILSDIVEIPNLRSKASTVLKRKLGLWLLGIEPPDDPFLPQRHQWLFALYTVASAVYRWVVCFSILWFLSNVFRPYGLEVIGQLIAMAALFSLVVMPIWQLIKFFYVPGRVEKVNRKRAIASMAGAALVVAALLLVPLPYYVECPFQIQPRGAANVYVDVPGQLQAIHVRPGQKVRAGQPLFTLASNDVELTLARLEGQREQLLSRVDDLRRRQYHETQAASEIAEAEESLRSLELQVEDRRQDIASLNIVAPATGVVIEPPRVPRKMSDRRELPQWHGTPLENRNLHAALDGGVLLCRLGDIHELEAIIDVDQWDVEFVRSEQTVKLKLHALPADIFTSRIDQVAQLQRDMGKHDQDDRPNKRSGDAGAQQGRLTTKYQASASLVDSDGVLLPGATGTARIHTGYRSVGQRAARYFSQTFRFR